MNTAKQNWAIKHNLKWVLLVRILKKSKLEGDAKQLLQCSLLDSSLLHT